MRRRVKDIIITALCVTAIGMTLHYHYYVRESYVTCEESGVRADGAGRLSFAHPYARLYSFRSPDGNAEFIWVSRTKYSSRQAKENTGNVTWSPESDRGDGALSKEGFAGNTAEVGAIYYIPKAYVHFRFSDEPETARQELKDLEAKSELLWEADM